MFVPTKMFLTKGVGIHREELQSFELALRQAGVQFLNIVSVSSILPPKCEIISRDKGLKLLQPGQIAFCVMAKTSSNEPSRHIAASIGVAIPSDKETYGYLSEHHTYGKTAEQAGEYAEDLAAAMLASTLGVEFDEDESWDNKRQAWMISGKIVRSRNITQTAEVGKEGKWKTVIAAAVLLP
ncbi:pyruvoyl-dependent arginine decarboxylase [Candidatus Zixiibacteriota bacterium]